MVAEAGPSTGQRMQKRPRKGARPAPQNAKKAKKVSEKQRIEQLELAVQDFVSTPPPALPQRRNSLLTQWFDRCPQMS